MVVNMSDLFRLTDAHMALTGS